MEKKSLLENKAKAIAQNKKIFYNDKIFAGI